MSKYVIKNCPAAFNTRVDGTYCNDVEITNGKNIHCQDCNDCVLKQIVELCKHYKKHSDCWLSGSFLNKVINKLEIQRVLQ